jgi:hypothetical protein
MVQRTGDKRFADRRLTDKAGSLTKMRWHELPPMANTGLE